MAMILCYIFKCNGSISNDTFQNITKSEMMSYVNLAVIYIITGLLTSYLYKNYSVMEVAPYKNALVPLLQFVIGFLIFKDKPTTYKVIGGLLMVVGIYLFSLSKN